MSTFLAVLVLVALAVGLYRLAGGPWHGYVPRHARPGRVRVQLRSHR